MHVCFRWYWSGNGCKSVRHFSGFLMISTTCSADQRNYNLLLVSADASHWSLKSHTFTAPSTSTFLMVSLLGQLGHGDRELCKVLMCCCSKSLPVVGAKRLPSRGICHQPNNSIARVRTSETANTSNKCILTASAALSISAPDYLS